MARRRLVLVTGATGYVGGRLVPRLLEEGYPVRVLVRDPSRLLGRPWSNEVEVVKGDVLKPETLPAAVEGASAVYYLVHSMAAAENFRQRDLDAAHNMAEATRRAAVERIIYLSGLGDPQESLSPHLRSRQETGAALRESGVPVTEFRAAIVVGAGSVSFEMIRYLTERLPVMLCPRWVFTHVQPIAIRDVLSYLITALKVPESAGEIIEIGGAGVMTYADMLMGYARVRHLRRLLLPLPLLTPRLSAYWVHLITPIPSSIAFPLVEGLRCETVVRDDKARRLFPDIHPIDYEAAVRLALARLQAGQVETTWSGALAASRGESPPATLTTEEGVIVERRQRRVTSPSETVYRVFSGLGGDNGWLYANWIWTLRGEVDRILGGVGYRRGRRDPSRVRPGEVVDSWRVEEVEPNRLLRLRSEMRMPGHAWLQFEAHPQPDGTTLLIQTTCFVPKGVLSLAYWYLLYPIHSVVFAGLIREIARQAENLSELEERTRAA